MSPPTAGTPSFLPLAVEYLGRCEDVCRRISLSLNKRALDAHDGPLTVLLRDHVNSLEDELACHRTHIRNFQPDADVFGEVTRAVACTKARVLELLRLQHFHDREERNGHDGALNALFARRFLLGDNCAYEDEDKLVRVGLELTDLIREVLPASVRCGSLGQDVHQQLVPKIDDFFVDIEKQFRPRYVHTYATLQQAPYTFDNAALSRSGSYGVVSKVNHIRTGETLAIKTIHRVFGKDPTRQILREIGILEVCDHKNIIRLVEAFKTEDNGRSFHLVLFPWAPFTLQDFLDVTEPERPTRCAWFQPGSPDSDRVVYRIMYELADAVSYLHANAIKHKDIKPENILLYREGDAAQMTPLITDFGVSKIYAKHAATNYTGSTRAYLAPEQLDKQSSTLKADVWQLGCCFAHLLALMGRGKLGHEELIDSYMRSADENCSFVIAAEHAHFMDALSRVCLPGTSSMRRVYGVVSGMLNLDPSERFDIELVRTALAKFAGTSSL